MTSGILNLNKPGGMTSFAVVSLVRRLTGVRRVGHAGTLDPIADGVLPIMLGQATRVVDELVSAPKTYYTTVHLGIETASYDSEGEVVATADASAVTEGDVTSALPRFVGEIAQLPPMYSALKYAGQPLYRYARSGRSAPREPRTVSVYRLALRRFAPPLVDLEMEVGRGAYVRTIAHDLGEALGCHAHVERLTRLRSGPFTVEEAVGLETLREAVEAGAWEALLHPIDRVLETWDAAVLDEEHTQDVRQGRLLALSPLLPGLERVALEAPCRAYSTDGDFLGVLRYRGAGRWHPEKVFAPAGETPVPRT